MCINIRIRRKLSKKATSNKLSNIVWYFSGFSWNYDIATYDATRTAKSL